MKKRSHPGLAEKIYTLCYRITACRSAAAALALEALTFDDPLRQAIRLSMDDTALPDDDTAATPWDRAFFALSRNERLALLLIDSLHLSTAQAARCAEMPEYELIALVHAARLKLAKNV